VGAVVTVVGNIGSGKSTAVRALGFALDAAVYEEDYQSNPYLERFYADPARWAFRSQLQFMADAMPSDLEARQGDGTAITELSTHFVHCVMSAELYAQGTIGDEEFALLGTVADALGVHLRPPDLLILLEAPVYELKRRIRRRGRGFEQRISATYLQRISSRYREVADAWRHSPLLRLDTCEVDLREESAVSDAVQQVEALIAT
jgi:deoxyadenosine/deoxycytidine kinase